jgi:hypothetical protein
MGEQREIQNSLNRGLAYLVAVQRPDGGFDSFSSPSASRFEQAFTYQTTFVPSLILAALNGLQTPVRQRLADYLRDQRSPLGSYNYWAKDSPQRRLQPYPDDLDDTCCALIGLVLNGTALEPADLAAFVKLLVNAEVRPGGPYRTWLVPTDSAAVWRDIDLAVNANVAYLLSLVSQPLPNLTAFIEAAVRKEQLRSPYYASAYPLIYYLSRAYQGPLTGKLLAATDRLPRRTARTPLEVALQKAMGRWCSGY